MIQTVTKNEFIEIFKSRRPDNFTYEALELIFEFITEYEAESEMSIELDVIGICCDFSEATLDELITDYRLPADVTMEQAEEIISDKTLLLGVTSSDTFVFQSF